jgi:hypothetical protein
VATDKRLQTVNNIHSHLKTRKEDWKTLWQDVADYIAPEYEDIEVKRRRGEKQGRKMHDATAVEASEIFTSGIYSHMVNKGINWFRFRYPDEALMDTQIVQEWIQLTEKAIRRAFNNSNFYREVFPFIKAGGTICTSLMTIEEDVRKGNIFFNNIHPSEYVIMVDGYRNVNGFILEWDTTLQEIADRLGKDVLPKNKQQTMDNNPFAKETIRRAILPREMLGDEFDPRQPGVINMPWVSIWILGSEIIHEGGFTSLPGASWRYQLYGSDWYGRGPGTQASVDIKQLNLMSKDQLRQAQLKGTPPLNIPSAMEGEVNISPLGFNYVPDGSQGIQPVNIGGEYPISLDREQMKQDRVKKAFHVDFFLMLQSQERQMTATEILERQGEKISVLGPMIGRFTSEPLSMILDRVIDIEMRAGRIPEPPEVIKQDILLNPGNNDLQIDYQGPLAQAQRELASGTGIARSLERILPLAQVNPEILDNFDMDVISREIAESSHMPAEGIRPKADVDRRRKQRKALQDAQRKLEAGNVQSETVKNLAAADKDSGGQLSQAAQGAPGVGAA